MPHRTPEEIEALRAHIYEALARGDEARAHAGIEALRTDEPAEAAGLLTALHIEGGRADAALDAWRACVPDDPYTVFLRARIHLMQRERGAALRLLRSVMGQTMRADVAEKIYNLAGQCARFFGHAAEAVAWYAQARDAAQELSLRALNESNVLFNRHYLPASLAEDRRAAQAYGALFADAVQFVHQYRTKGERRLRIGYLSPDVREHVVLSFSYALFTALDRSRFEVFVYAMNRADDFTERVRRNVDGFRNLSGQSAAEAARVIYEDRIDILMDLAGHTAGGMLPVLAYRPVPVQVSGIGYFASTGLETVDYFLADPVLAAGHAQEGFTEQLLVLPRSHFCWQPLHPAPAPAHAPATGRGIVFGSFNNFTKVNDDVLAVWAEILRRVPCATLLLKAEIFSDPDGRAEALRGIEAAGIPLARVTVEEASTDYLSAYARVDIALDTFPYPGGGTTCDALYMGVPVVSLAGESAGSRFGASLLTNVGLSALIAHTQAGYIDCAVSLAQDTARLDDLHRRLRLTMEASPVMDAAAYGRDVGAAFAGIWAAYVSSQPQLSHAQRIVLAGKMEAWAAGDAVQARAAASHILAARSGDAPLLIRTVKAMLAADAGAEAAAAAAQLLDADDTPYARILAAYAARLAGNRSAVERLLAGVEPEVDALPRETAGMAYHLGARLAKERGETARAARLYRASAACKTDETGRLADLGNALLMMTYGGFSRAAYMETARTYGALLDDAVPFVHTTARHTHARLRIGYISPDFGPHVVAHFARAFFWHADRARFAVYGYTLGAENEIAARFAARADGWRSLAGHSPQAAARVIYDDEIDILFDLSGHTAGSALPVLAYRPAPVQISGIGYFASTGLSAVDYFLVDAHTAAEGEERFFTERLLALPSSHLCYLPFLSQDMPIAPPPCSANGYVTFGSLGDAAKLSDELLAAWARILSAVPDARLFLKSGAFDDDTLCEAFAARLARAGIDIGRVRREGRSADYMAAYAHIDIALDTFPYPGGGTTCDALYMGVPVVTRAGESHHGNFGRSMLENVGCPALVAADTDAYVRIAVQLAEDAERRAYLRGILRYRLLDAPLGNGARYMAEVEEGYLEIWRRWCAQQGRPAARKNVRARVFDALEQERWASARVLTQAAMGGGADDMMSYLHAYAVERMGDLPQATARAERYLSSGRTALRHEFMRLRAAVAYRAGDPQAAEFYFRASAEEPEDVSLYSSFLLAQNAQEADEDALFRAHRAYERFFADVPRYTHGAHRRHEKIRVGYISPDFRRNVMRHFVQPMLTAHDRRRFEVYAYSLAEHPDDVTAALRPQADVWRDMGGCAPDAAAARIYADEIDVLVDLAGHAAGGALPVLARRPASVQMMGLGYTATSGLSTVDYFLTDAVCDPPGTGRERYFTERLVYLPSQFCYVPQAGLPASAGTPARTRGTIVFGVFNQYRKFTDEMLALWRDILARVPTAQLLMKSQVLFSPAMAEAVYTRLMRMGFDMGRVILEPADTGYMRRYLDVDIALDTYPWPGGGTTCDALYMGVPVVTMYGARRSTRFSYALLAHIGPAELAVRTPAAYVEAAVALAGDLDTLDALHRGLRGMMERSPVMDQRAYVRALEEAYRCAMETADGRGR